MSDKYVQIKEKVNTTQNGVFYNQLDKFQTNKLFFVLSALNLQNNNVNIYIFIKEFCYSFTLKYLCLKLLLSYNGIISFKFKFDLHQNTNKKIGHMEIRLSVIFLILMALKKFKSLFEKFFKFEFKKGSKINLIHVSREQLTPGVDNLITIRLNEALILFNSI